MSPCTWGVLYQMAEKPAVWTLSERPVARLAAPGGKRIGSKAPLCSRKGEVRLSDRDEGWKSALDAHIQAIFCGGTEKDGLRALANSKGVRPLPWRGLVEPAEKAMGSISRMRLSVFHLPSVLLRVLRCSRSRARLFLYNEEMAFMATAGGSGCFYARAARRKPAKRRLITQKCVAHGGMEKR